MEKKFSKKASLLDSARLMEYTSGIYQKVELSKKVSAGTSQIAVTPRDNQIRTLGQNT